jgi:peptidyl-prolyl cis-trans isomerase C
MRRAQYAAPVILAAILAPVLAPALAPALAVVLAAVLTVLPAQPGAWAQQPDGATDQAPATERLGTALQEFGRENPLLAVVNGKEIRWADIEKSAQGLPEDVRSQLKTIFPALLQRLIDVQLLVWAAREDGLVEDAEVRRLVAEYEDRVLSDTLIRRRIADRVTEDMLQARYDSHIEGLAARAEVRARHILLDSEARALEVIAALEAGADFAELARARSLGPTAAQGGDLDYFTRDNMIAGFSAAAFALEVGQYSPDPVQTEFGWHVIKVEDRRVQGAASYVDMRDDLREAIIRELLDELLRDLRGRAEIELYPEAQPEVQPGARPEIESAR